MKQTMGDGMTHIDPSCSFKFAYLLSSRRSRHRLLRLL